MLKKTTDGQAADEDVGVLVLTPNGRPDPAFGQSGWFVFVADVEALFGAGFQPADESAHGIGVAPDGGLTVFLSVDSFRPLVPPDAPAEALGIPNASTGSGPPTPPPGEARRAYALLRLTRDGRPDTSFDGDGIALNTDLDTIILGARVTAIQPDGKVLIAGGESNRLVVQRLNPDGRPDPTFGAGGEASVSFGSPFPPGGAGPGQTPAEDATSVRADTLDVMPDGRILVKGHLTRYFSTDYTAVLARLGPDGVPDSGFGDGGGLVTESRDLLTGYAGTDAAGRVVLYAPYSGYGSNSIDGEPVRLYRLAPDGRPDSAFGTDGVALPATAVPEDVTLGARAAIVRPDGRVLVSYSAVGREVAFLQMTDGESVPPPPAPRPVYAAAEGGVSAFTLGADGRLAPDEGNPFDGFSGEVRAVAADVNGDGYPDAIAAAGPGGRSRVRVVFGQPPGGAVVPPPAEWLAFEEGFTGGAFVAAGDLNGDGRADIVVTPGAGGGPVVAAYDGAGLAAGWGAAAEVTRFFGIEDPGYRGGATAAVGDIDGDGRPELVAAAGPGGGPRVAVYDGRHLLGPLAGSVPPRLVPDFFAFGGPDDERVWTGVRVAAGDLTGDGRAELVFGGGPGGGPRVLALDGHRLAGGDVDGARAEPVADFFVAGDPAPRSGVQVAVRTPDRGGPATLLTGSGAGRPSGVRVYPWPVGLRSVGSEPADVQGFDLFTTSPADGVFVG